MMISTVLSTNDDEADDHPQFLPTSSHMSSLPSLITTVSSQISNGILPSHATIDVNRNEHDSLFIDDVSYSVQPARNAIGNTTLDIPRLHAYRNLSISNSETNLAQPLIVSKQAIVSDYTSSINHDDEQISTSSSSTTSTGTIRLLTPNYCSYMTLYFTDMLISAFIITPLVNIHWRGAWDLLDIHLLPDYPQTSALISLAIGLLMLYVIYLTQGYLQVFYEKHRHHTLGQIMTRLYTLLLALAYINQWRGLWNLLDLTSNAWYHLLGETVICISFLLVIKSAYNLNSAPFLIGIDTESYFLLDSKHSVSVRRIHFIRVEVR
jgi:hypothetical protein